MTLTTIPYADPREQLADELGWLDDALLALVRAAHHEAPGTSWFVSPRDAEELFAAVPSDDMRAGLAQRRAEIEARRRAARDEALSLPLDLVTRQFGLEPADRLALVACLAGELDGRYGKLYGYLHDDLGQRRPSPQIVRDLVRLAGGDPAAALIDSPALRWGLLRAHRDTGQPVQELALDPLVASFLATGSLPPDEQVQFLRHPPHSALADGPYVQAAARLTRFLDRSEQPAFIYFHGPAAREGVHVAAAACAARGLPVAHADLAELVAACDEGALEFEAGLRGIFRHVRLCGAAVHLSGFDTLLDGARGATRAALVADLMRETGAVTCADGTRLSVPAAVREGLAFLPFALELPDFEQRRDAWRAAAAGLKSEQARTLAARFRSTATEIANAVRLAGARAAADGSVPGFEDMLWASRAHARTELAALARVVSPRAAWADLVAPDDVRAQLHELCGQVRARATVLYDWGFDRGDARGTGATALFLGPSGVGKTLAAEVVAHDLETDLITVDLSAVVSKYIGETEKNLQRVITAADRSGGVLFFDEADALFGRRTEIHDAHDRYANLELSFLLQRLEDYEGVAILASNLAQNIDDAFVRRIAITIEFPFPDASARAAIWRRHIPAATPLDGDIDFDRLGAAFKVTGGVIRKIAWNAAFLAADDGDRLALHHIARAARREYARMGKPFPADEEGP